jgi:hypothetical protein
LSPVISWLFCGIGNSGNGLYVLQARFHDRDIRVCIFRASLMYRIRVRLVLIDRRSPINRNAAKDEAEKEPHVQPATPAHQDMVSFNNEHVWLCQ